MLTAEYPPYHWGGVGTSSWSLANGFAERGHQVTVVTRKNDLEPVYNHPSVRFVQVPWLKFPMAFALSFGKNAAKWVKSQGPDAFDAVLVHSNMTLLPAWAYAQIPQPILSHMCGNWAGERSGLRLSRVRPFSVSGANDLAVKVLSPRYDKYEDLAVRRSDGVIIEAVSEERAWNERLKRKFPSDPEASAGSFMSTRPHVRRVVVPVDMRGYTPDKRSAEVRAAYAPGGAKLFLFVGRLAGRKNPIEAFEVFERYVAGGGDAHLLVVGRGNQERRMRRRAASSGVADRVHFLEGVPVKKLQVLYASADLFVFPSTWEGYGIVMVESACAGTPVLARPVGAVPEIISPEVGAPYHSVDEAVGAVPRLLDLDRAKVAATMHALFDWEKIMDDYEGMLEDLVREGKTRSKGEGP
jgi:glycosyltransferase involved in cell wall biosynthesis